jgi:hypothetical protein
MSSWSNPFFSEKNDSRAIRLRARRETDPVGFSRTIPTDNLCINKPFYIFSQNVASAEAVTRAKDSLVCYPAYSPNRLFLF